MINSLCWTANSWICCGKAKKHLAGQGALRRRVDNPWIMPLSERSPVHPRAKYLFCNWPHLASPVQLGFASPLYTEPVAFPLTYWWWERGPKEPSPSSCNFQLRLGEHLLLTLSFMRKGKCMSCFMAVLFCVLLGKCRCIWTTDFLADWTQQIVIKYSLLRCPFSFL